MLKKPLISIRGFFKSTSVQLLFQSIKAKHVLGLQSIAAHFHLHKN